jgi:hypothetical protein
MNIPGFTAQASLYRKSNSYRSSTLDFGGESRNQSVVPAQGCPVISFFGTSLRGTPPRLHLIFNYWPVCNDVLNVRWATPGGDWQQFEIGTGSCPPNGPLPCTYNVSDRININLDKPYLFAIQSCRTRFASSSVCGPWSKVAHYLPHGWDTCVDGYVWRQASASDHVCVVPRSRDDARRDNALAASRVSRTDRTYGPDTCIPGYVWREAFPNDHVCVPPATRTRTLNENADAWRHFARNWS